MGEQTKKTKRWKWIASAVGATALGAAVAFGVLTLGSDETEPQSVDVSVTPTVLIAEASSTPEQTVIMTPKPTPTLIPTETPTATPTEAATVTPEPTISDTPTLEPTEEPSPTPTEEAMPTDTVTPTQFPTNTPTIMPTASPKPTATPTVKLTSTPTVTPKPTATPTMKSTATPRLTNTPAPTNTPMPTETPIPTPTNTPTPSTAPAAWTEPKERKDLAELLMAKVNAYRESKGLRRWEDPFVYYESDYPELGEYMTERGLRVAKKCCLEHSASHEHSQIGTGVYFYPWQVTDIWIDEMVDRLFDNWYQSPAHNKNMLYDGGGEEDWIAVAVMHVVEHFDGEDWHYCAIMTVTFVSKDNLPEGLE